MTVVEALQTTLAGEHAAVYAYGALGGRTSQAGAPALYVALRDAYSAHRAQRDQLTLVLRDLGVDPVVAEAAYDIPVLATASAVAAAAAELEERCATTYAALVAESVGDQRRWAVNALTTSAVRRTGFGAAPEEFPGAADLSS